MSYRTVKLLPEAYDFVLTRVESGRYESASEVMRAALQALHREEKAVEKRSARSVADEDVFRKLWERSAASSPLSHRRSKASVTHPS
ncbi:MAG: type II toxin-antitoxin system ParD family antitoxin [Terracidiphilus sp.]